MARNHSKRHILTRSLGMQSSVQSDINTFLLEDGDRILLCSDGLYDLVDEENYHANDEYGAIRGG